MRNVWIAAVAAFGLLVSPAAAQDAKTVIGNASRAMGVDSLNSIHYYGVAANGQLGQNNNSSQPWPVTAANDYVRAIDFTQRTSRATWQNYAVPVTGGAAALAPGQQVINAQSPWAQQIELYITPWGFLKAAATNTASVKAQTLDGKRYNVVTVTGSAKSPGGQPYRVVGYINRDTNMVDKVQTWLDHEFYGDMLIDADYLYYRDNNGLKYPARIVQTRAGWPTFSMYVLGANANPANLQALMTPPAPAGRGGAAPGGAPAGGGRGAAAAAPTSEKLAEGVFRINGAYNALAVEMADYVVLFEPGPQNLERARAVINETKRVIPNKPIRYGVISHHHLDHTQGLAEAVAEGITIVTPAVNRAYLMSAMSAPRTLAPDTLSKSGKKPLVEGFTGDKRVFQDGTRTFEIHVIKGLPHADGLVIGWLPKEKLLVYADMFNLPTDAAPVPNPPVVGTQVFATNMERLSLDPERIMSVHSLNPDRLTSRAELLKSLGR
ncbi:MAG TPA: MBL fold metallo-hydrolase [Vicinamibacterales bacterium]|nr:MBL fold metallo-hydrolase [Vicinamibacterales bacterium]